MLGIDGNSSGSAWSQSRGRNGMERWEGFVEKEVFMPRMKERGSSGWTEYMVFRSLRQ